MSIVQFDSQKIEQLLNSATSERERKMYQALLDKARSQERSSTDSSAPCTTPSTEKKLPNTAVHSSGNSISAGSATQTRTKGKTETKKKTQTLKKNQKADCQSAIIEASTPTKKSKKTVTKSSKHTPDSSEVPPQTQLKSQDPKPQKQQLDAEPTFFQAVGALIATPYLQDELLKVAINGSEYDLLYVPGFRRQAYTRLKAELKKNGSEPMFLRLYPNAKFSKSLENPLLSFFLVNFSLDCEKINDEPIGFVLKGIWQYSPQYKSPVISIYRNGCQPQLEFFKKLNSQQQFYFTQPRHIPVVWNAPVEPFKFNPQAKKGSQMPRYFVEVRATFKDGVYVVEEMLSEPTLKIPKFFKVPKKKQPKSVKKAAPKSDS